MPSLDRQLRLLRAFALLTYPFACVPFLFPYFVGHGIDAAGYGVILSAYYAAMLLAEVPTGLLADRFGPKGMLVLGPLVLLAGFATLLVWPCYAGFLTGEVLLGLGHAILSGPPTTLLYETLRAHGQEHRYLQEEARIQARRMLGTGTAFLLGGVIAQLGDHEAPADPNYGRTIVATCAFCALAALIALGVPRLTPSPTLRAVPMLQKVAGELRRPGVLWLCAYWLVLFTLLRFPFHDYQPYLQATSAVEPLFADPLFVGGLFAGLNLIAVPFSSLLPRLVARYGRLPFFWGMPLVLAVSLMVMGAERLAADSGHGSTALAWLGVSMFVVQQVPFGMHLALIHEFVNHRISPPTRTTVLSALSLCARAVYALVNVALFQLQAAHGIGTALLTAGGGGLVAAFAVLWWRPRGVLRGQAPIA